MCLSHAPAASCAKESGGGVAERLLLRDLEPPNVDGSPERSAEDTEEGELGGGEGKGD